MISRSLLSTAMSALQGGISMRSCISLASYMTVERHTKMKKWRLNISLLWDDKKRAEAIREENKQYFKENNAD